MNKEEIITKIKETTEKQLENKNIKIDDVFYKSFPEFGFVLSLFDDVNKKVILIKINEEVVIEAILSNELDNLINYYLRKGLYR